MSDAAQLPLDLRERLAQIDRAQEETRTFVQQQHKRVQEALKLSAEEMKLRAEDMKLRAEETKLRADGTKTARDTALAPWQIVVTAMGTGAALFAAGAAFLKLLQH